MLAALATDFSRLPQCSVTVLRDHRISLDIADCTIHAVAAADEERNMISRIAQECDWTVVIAPEFNGFLLDRVELATSAGGRLLGPSAETIALAANKSLLAKQFSRADVPTPNGCTIDRGATVPDNFTFPAVLKQLDGAGSLNVQLVRNKAAARKIGAIDFDGRLERFIDGTPVSVSVLCGPNGNRPLPACRQHLSGNGQFTYAGGSLPLPDDLAAEAQRLAIAAVQALPDPLGYIGVDVVLGNPTGEACVIEVNPRLTTSYVGLRAACRQNLATAMIAVALGQSTELSFRPDGIGFDTCGNTWIDSTSQRDASRE